MRTRSLALLFLSVLAQGCTVVVSGGGTWTPPPGTEVRIDASWTINGSYPTPALCQAAGIDWVVLELYNSANDTAYYAPIDHPCETQRVVTPFNLPPQIYHYEWVAYDADGFESFRSTRASEDLSLGGTWYADADFAADITNPGGNDLAVYGTYDIDGPGATLADACAWAGIDWVEIVILDSTGTYEYYYDELWEYCGDSGEIDSLVEILPAGSFRYVWRAYDEYNYIVDEGAVTPFPAAAGGYIDAGDMLFGLNAYLYVDLYYEMLDSPGFYDYCWEAGASGYTFTWTLYDGDPEIDGEPVYTDQGDDLCWDWIYVDDSVDDLLVAGYPYYLEIYSTNAGATAWGLICEIELDTYGYTYAECDVPLL